MQTFDLIQECEALAADEEIVQLLTTIRSQTPLHDAFCRPNGHLLTESRGTALRQSVSASCALDGITVPEARLRLLMVHLEEPETPEEKAAAGCRDVMEVIMTAAPYLTLTPALVLQLHRGLCRYTGNNGGLFRLGDPVTETSQPAVPAAAVRDALSGLFAAYEKARQNPETDALLLIPVFLAHFRTIAPFDEANGRMSRLLSLLLLLQAGIEVVRTVSSDAMLAERRLHLESALQADAAAQAEGQNAHAFVRFWLSLVADCGRDFEENAVPLAYNRLTRRNRVAAFMRASLEPVRIRDLRDMFPYMSDMTVKYALGKLIDRGLVTKRRAENKRVTFIWNWANDSAWSGKLTDLEDAEGETDAEAAGL